MKPDWTSVLELDTQRRRMVDPSLCERTIRFSQTGIREAIVAGSFEIPLLTLKGDSTFLEAVVRGHGTLRSSGINQLGIE